MNGCKGCQIVYAPATMAPAIEFVEFTACTEQLSAALKKATEAVAKLGKELGKPPRRTLAQRILTSSLRERPKHAPR